MKYIIRTVIVILGLPVLILGGLGFIVFIILSLLQIPIWYIATGGMIDDDYTLAVWYTDDVIGKFEKFWNWLGEKGLR